MAALHEVLAVEGELAGLFKGILEEAKTTFDKKANLFQGFVKRYDAFDPNKPTDGTGEQVEVSESVPHKLEYVFGHAVRYLDCVLQKEATNQVAKADLVVELDDGQTVTLGKDIPATFLLGLETKLRQIRDVLQAIPTLPSGMTWVEDTGHKLPGVFRRTEPEIRFKTEKAVKHAVLAPATDKHPAQIEKWNEDVPVGKFTTVHYSGMLTPSQKSKLLARIDLLGRAVKQARQRANTALVQNARIGAKLVEFILNQ